MVLKWIASRLGTQPARRRDAQADALELISQERYAEAAEMLRPAVEDQPHPAQAWNLLGVCHSLALHYPEAADCYAMALQCDPGLVDAYANAGWNSRLLGKPEAQEYFRQWLLRTRTASPAPAWPGARLALDDVTLCCIDCANYELAADALRFTLERCRFADALFLSDRDCAVQGVRHVPVESIRSSAQYSNFVVHRLHEHVATGYVLIIQYDGFVLNPGAWDAEFLRYDYLGARISVNGMSIVGNGGFSLRSRRLLQALRDDDEVRRYDASRDPLSEDLAICHGFRARLEGRHGIRFAPEALADRFSAELKAPGADNFGFHNLIHLVSLRQGGFRPAGAEDGAVDIVFSAPTAEGVLRVQRQIELKGNERFLPLAQA